MPQTDIPTDTPESSAPTIVLSSAPSMPQTDIPTDTPKTYGPTLGPTRAPTPQTFGMPNAVLRACPVFMLVSVPLLCTHTTRAQMRPCPSCMATRPRSVCTLGGTAVACKMIAHVIEGLRTCASLPGLVRLLFLQRLQ
jgi:hypothetical protein